MSNADRNKNSFLDAAMYGFIALALALAALLALVVFDQMESRREHSKELEAGIRVLTEACSNAVFEHYDRDFDDDAVASCPHPREGYKIYMHQTWHPEYGEDFYIYVSRNHFASEEFDEVEHMIFDSSSENYALSFLNGGKTEKMRRLRNQIFTRLKSPMHVSREDLYAEIFD